MATQNKMTEQQKEWLKEHFNDMLRAELARKLGVSDSAIRYYIRKFGGKMDLYRARRLPGVEKRISMLYRTLPSATIARMTGVCVSTVNNIARQLGLKRDKEFLKKKKEEEEKRIEELLAKSKARSDAKKNIGRGRRRRSDNQ